jgi:hypothetical protein
MTMEFRLPRKSGPQVTDRDLDILAWIALHGIVTTEQVARHFFDNGRDDPRAAAFGLSAAYRRIRKLRQLDLVRVDQVRWRHPSVLRVTPAGAHISQTGIAPATLVHAEIDHALAVVDLLEELRPQAPAGAEITTEREFRLQRRREAVTNPRLRGRGRIPDAVLSWDGQTIAVELDRTNKRSFNYEQILNAYMQESFDKVWWYVRPTAVERLQKVVHDHRADDLVEVRPWKESGSSSAPT